MILLLNECFLFITDLVEIERTNIDSLNHYQDRGEVQKLIRLK